ncbi:MAG TPA: hypoxanthine phosphoribosyltransferase [Verrucomicrobiales bacterium]|nr:hypoxanthine phosphoribosyltransferase [Verrucomicrobiales bacterium]
MANPLLPEHLRKEVESVLIDEKQIATRVSELAADIERDFIERDLLVVALLTGTVPFLADLIRNITLPLRLDFMGVSSYGNNTAPGELVFTKELKLEAKNRDVLIVDDILDTGKTLRAVMDKLDALQPRSLRTCVMLEKKSRRSENITADYVGFDVPDAFVVGYGLDYAEKYRNLPFIGVLKPEVYS